MIALQQLRQILESLSIMLLKMARSSFSCHDSNMQIQTLQLSGSAVEAHDCVHIMTSITVPEATVNTDQGKTWIRK